MVDKKRDTLLWTTLLALNGGGLLLSLCLGRYGLSPGLVGRILISSLTGIGDMADPIAYSVLMKIRLPRVIMASAGGIGLGICGALFQGIFRNPMVSPGVVGVTSGAGFGAALAILILGWDFYPQLFAFLFGMGALFCTWTIARKTKSPSLLVFVLAGVIVNMFFQALISLVKFTADSDDELPSIVYWLMGSLSSCSWKKVLFAAPPILIASLFLILMRNRINLLSLGEEEVKSLGIDPRGMMNSVLILTSLIVASVVSVAGIVGWIGLIIPHIARMIVGADHGKLLPASALMGSLFFLTIDNIGRTLFAQDIPLGILTALIGAPLFIGLLIKTRGEWNL